MASQPHINVVMEHLRMVIYFNVASAAVLVYDYFLTLPAEVAFVWFTRWTAMKVLFLLARYLPFIDIGIFMYYHFGTHNAERCYTLFKTSAWLFHVGTVMPELILTTRAWAVWGGGWRLGAGLLVFLGACWSSVVVIIPPYLKSLRFIAVEAPPLFGCLVTKGSNIISICWILLLVYESGIAFLMLFKGIRCYREGGYSGFSLVVYRDGLLYYMYLFALSLANVIVLYSAPPDLQVVLVLTERVFHPILACRVVLTMRAHVASQQSGPSPPSYLTAPIPFVLSSRRDSTTSPVVLQRSFVAGSSSFSSGSIP